MFITLDTITVNVAVLIFISITFLVCLYLYTHTIIVISSQLAVTIHKKAKVRRFFFISPEYNRTFDKNFFEKLCKTNLSVYGCCHVNSLSESNIILIINLNKIKLNISFLLFLHNYLLKNN